MWYVYVLESQKNGNLYKGFCKDLKKRVLQHNAGETYSTKSGVPWNLIYYEAFIDKDDAIVREKYLKTGWGRRSLQKMLHNYFKNTKE
ncbi:MAG: hypothetical protein CR972_03820 [Candidatus Moraniibacteriota bacterium]|nr:MAG: hypothetical protein CR972_03820 [Candidatus Moranbacteria bacterium]